MGTLKKRRRHSHYWVEDEILYESYYTIRGIRYCSVHRVDGMNNIEMLTNKQIKEIESKYCKLEKQY